MRHEAYEITQLMDRFKASVFALITLRQGSKGSSVRNTKASVEAAKNHVFEGGNFSSEECIILSKLHDAVCDYWKIPIQPPNEAQVKEEMTSNSIND